jgi:spoIIIJ-associated protein
MTAERSGEFRAKTVEAAIAAGLAALRLTREQVEVEIVRPGSRGVLGIGAEDAVVRLRAGSADRTSEPAMPTPAPVAVEPAPRAQPAASRVETPPVRAQPEARPASPRAESAPAAKAARQETSRPARPAGPSGGPEREARAELGRQMLSGLLERMELAATVEVTQQSDAEAEEGDRVLVLNIVGEDLGVLIGRQNETLSALEFITRLMVNQQSHGRSDFVVDVNGYRAKRAEALRRLGLRTAEQVAQSGRTMALEPMPPAERRIIHLALRDHPKVFTQSVGEGDRRKVTVVLKKE